MLPDQETGGSVERQRNMSTSAPGAGGDAENMQEGEVQIQSQAQDEQKALNKGKRNSLSSQESPRRCISASQVTAERPHMLRSPSSSSSMSSSSTPTQTPTPLSSASSRSSSSKATKSAPQAQLEQEQLAQQLHYAEPPVTRSTLSELDVSKIIHNPKLRHDINYDPELHFRPNVEGDRGPRKQARASHFWTALLGELTEFVLDRPAFYQKHGYGDDWCLPALLKVVKEIIQTLVPQRDRQFLDEGLNVELLMQQFHKGVADLEKLALWLRNVLKSHCAPMRDNWVDTMYDLLSRGNREGDLPTLVDGMRSLLNVLEAMKLDVANHQIRCLRPVLIEDTVHFEQKFFVKRIQASRFDITSAKEWYAEAHQAYTGFLSNASHTFGDSTVFFDGLTRLVMPSSPKAIPTTFTFDEDRLLRIRADMLDMVNLDICMNMHKKIEDAARRYSAEIPRPASVDSMEDFDFNTPPTSSRPSSLVFSSAGSAHSSPRSSMAVPSYVAHDLVDAKTKARNLYNSLVALLKSEEAGSAARQMERWRTLAPSMALEVMRFTPNLAPHLAHAYEQTLADNLRSRASASFQQVEQSLRGRLMDALGRLVREFRGMSGLQLFSLSSGSRANPLSHLSREGEGDAVTRGLESLAVRIAHLGVLHWRVWADLAYVGDIEEMAVDNPQSQI